MDHGWRAVVATVLLISGTGLEVLALLGLTVMRDTFDRLHYVGLAGWGALVIGIAILVHESFSLIGDKALLTGVIVVVGGALLSHTTARSLLLRRAPDSLDEAN